MAYHDGIGTIRDQVTAVEYFRRAAERGHAEAQYHLGLVHELGHGVARDLAVGIAWERKAAGQGHSGAQYRMGAHCKAGGEGRVFNLSQSVEWYRKAAEQGHAASQWELGQTLSSRQGSSHKPDGSCGMVSQGGEPWAPRRAIQLGLHNQRGRCNSRQDRSDGMASQGRRGRLWGCSKVLGREVLLGDGVPRDRTQGMAWYLKAAEQKDCGAIYKLARMYAEGHEVPHDLVQAALWYRKAVDSGCDNDYGEAARWLEAYVETEKEA